MSKTLNIKCEKCHLTLPACVLKGAIIGTTNSRPYCDRVEKFLAGIGWNGCVRCRSTFHRSKGWPASDQREISRCPGLRWISQLFHGGLMVESGASDGVENPMKNLHGVVRPPLQHFTPWRCHSCFDVDQNAWGCVVLDSEMEKDTSSVLYCIQTMPIVQLPQMIFAKNSQII